MIMRDMIEILALEHHVLFIRSFKEDFLRVFEEDSCVENDDDGNLLLKEDVCG